MMETFEAQKQKLFAKMVYMKSAQQYIEGADKNKELSMSTKRRLLAKGIKKVKPASQQRQTTRRSLRSGSGCGGCRRSGKAK